MAVMVMIIKEYTQSNVKGTFLEVALLPTAWDFDLT
jgi:hypothetical protein